MNEQRVTIKDLAEKMNLSFSTISRALNDHPAISKETKAKVKQMAMNMGYYPNSIATNLRKNKSNSIGIIVPRIDVHFHSKAISGIEEVAYKAGYNVTIYQSKDSFEREIAITQNLQANMVDGVIVCLAVETKDCNHFNKFKKHNVPVVFYDRVSPDYDASKVIIDDFGSSFKAIEHLIEIGCKRIAHIAGNQKTLIFQARLEGYKEALLKHGLKFDKNLIFYTKELSYEEGEQCAKKMLNLNPPPDGVFCANDYTAVSAIQTFMKAKKKVPEDIAVVGFSDYPISRILQPSITTINDKAFEMGQTAAKLLIRHIEEKNSIVASETMVLKTELIKRESTKR